MGFYAVTGSLSPAGVADLHKLKAGGLRANLDRAAEKLGGKLDGLYFLAGDLSVLAVFDLPSKGSSAPILTMLASGGFQNGVAMLRFETAEEVDAQLPA